ncbi:thiosulfate sulfurtransferase [Betaproteobacteria bacterium]|nr:thiosulfate sulfurtransferase [Betaproteobacteria bacterium]GHT98478.1 thiosulfate sulfurtransferase [Betaproteobacteria bacterium]
MELNLITTTYADVRSALLERREIALLDVREEHIHAQAHPLFAAQLSLSRLELLAYARLPRRDVAVVTLDDEGAAGGRAERAAQRLLELGYTRVAVFSGGVKAWAAAGGELFSDVNVPSKSFGELVDTTLHTPALAASEVKALLDARADVVVVDVRRFDEYQAMNIPGAISVPGAELVLRVPELAPDPATRVIVNCAGRTRSIIGAQSLVNAGLPNPVAALRNGTIGWILDGLEESLEHGQTRHFPPVTAPTRQLAAQRARAVAERAGVKWVTLDAIGPWQSQSGRTTYFVDVRDPDEYLAGHLPGFCSVPGGQLVQETEMTATVRGARLVLADTDGARAAMTASWLAQMDWEVYVLTPPPAAAWHETGAWQTPLPPLPDVPVIAPATLAQWQQSSEPPLVIDLTTYANYQRAHIPGAWYALRADYHSALARLPRASRYVLTCLSGLLGYYSLKEFAALIADREGVEVYALDGGTNAWQAAGLPLEQEARLASDPIDRYRRPYEGTDHNPQAMQAYLDWEFGLVDQLARDGTHHFRVLQP